MKKTPKKNKTNVAQSQKDVVAEQREFAKAGMVSSLGTLFLTGFIRFRGSSNVTYLGGLGVTGLLHLASFFKHSKIEDVIRGQVG